MRYLLSILLLILLTISFSSFAQSPTVYLQSVTIHPYSEGVINCKITIDTEPEVDIAPVDVPGTGHRCRLDVTVRKNTGPHTSFYQACNVWDCGGVSPIDPFGTTVPQAGTAMQLSN